MNKPFLFTENLYAVSRLSEKLEDLKLEVHAVQASDSAYTPAIMTVSCPWMQEQEFAIVWNRRWWPDGMKIEDDYTTIEVDGLEVWRVDIGEMLRKKLQKPLTGEIIDRLDQGVNTVIRNKLKSTET